MQTLLKVTKANVWAIIEVAKSRLAMATGMRTHDSNSWGMKASDSMRIEGAAAAGSAEVR